jgi:hypothetical protein
MRNKAIIYHGGIQKGKEKEKYLSIIYIQSIIFNIDGDNNSINCFQRNRWTSIII